MFYEVAITVPAGTTVNNPIATVIKVTAGVLHHAEVRFRRGTDFRVGAKILHHGSQLYPTNPDGDFREDGRPIAFDTYFPLDAAPYELKVVAYAPTAVYDHVIYVRLGVLRPEEMQPEGNLWTALKKFLKMVGIS